MKKRLNVFLIFYFLFTLNLFAVDFSGGLVKFEVPKALEIQSDELSSIENLVYEQYPFFDLDSFQRIQLQQKGINSLEYDKLKQYCRIIISVTNTLDDNPIYNSDIKESWYSSSPEDRLLFTDSLQSGIDSTTYVKQWYPFTATTLPDGTFAIVGHYTRSSNSFDDDVDVKMYHIFCGYKTITITCSYRERYKYHFEPAFIEFFNSLTINHELGNRIDKSKKTATLYNVVEPLTNMKFMWPESNIEWQETEAPGCVGCILANLKYPEKKNYDIYFMTMKYSISFNSYMKSIGIKSLISTQRQILGDTLKGLCTIESDEIFEDQGRIVYKSNNRSSTYKEYGETLSKFISDDTILTVNIEYDDKRPEDIQIILESMGFKI